MSAPDRKLADMSFGVPSSMTPRQLYEHATGKKIQSPVSINGVPVQTLAKGVGKAVEALSGKVDDAGRSIGNTVDDITSDIKFYASPLTLENTPQSDIYKGDPYYHNILVGGCMAGGNNFITAASALPFGNLARAESKSLFRWNEMDKVREEIKNALAAGKHPRVVGHSWGGANIAGLAKDYPNVPFIALDPVSWTGRLDKTPANLTIFRPRENSDNKGFLLAELAPWLGGRWPKLPGEGKIEEYNGGHVSGIDDAISRYVHYVRRERERNERQRLANTPAAKANQIVKKSSAGTVGTVVHAKRPLTGSFAEKKNSYSDRGAFFKATIPSGRSANVYLRRTGTPNFAVETLGKENGRWNPDEIHDLVETLHGSPLLVDNGKIIGTDKNQAYTEILSHENANSDGGHRSVPLGAITGPIVKNLGRLLKPNEKNPEKETDMRPLPSLRPNNWKPWLEYLGHKINSSAVRLDNLVMNAALRMRGRGIPSVGVPGMIP